MNAILYYVHDPMCSWCWGFSRTLDELFEGLPEEIDIQRLLGGLAPDSDIPMSEAMQQSIKSNWLRIEESVSGVKFNFDFWDKTTPRRSTYPACRAVIAARKQGQQYDVLMTKEIQKAYYQEARNPSDNSILIELAADLNLDIDIFKLDLESNETQEKLMQEINKSRELYAESFPNLVLVVNDKIYSIRLNYNNSEDMLDSIKTIFIKH